MGRSEPNQYREDLAYIHDAGYGQLSLAASRVVLDLLPATPQEETVVDLGCGSGLLLRELDDAGYRVIGIDGSAAMIQLARRIVPGADLRVGSVYEADLPLCRAVTAIGEVINYTCDPSDHRQNLYGLFRRVYERLLPGGVFVFDTAEPGQIPKSAPIARRFSEGEGWTVLVEKEEDHEHHTLRRGITSFVDTPSGLYRRDREEHLQCLYGAGELASELRGIGFRVRVRRSYGEHRLPAAHAALIARKPPRDSSQR